MNENFNNNVSNDINSNNVSQQYTDTNVSQSNINISSNNQNVTSDKITLYDLNSPKPIENMPYIYCPNCNSKVIADSKFCSSCGTQISRR